MVGDAVAAELAAAFLADTLALIRATPGVTAVLATTADGLEPDAFPAGLAPNDLPRWVQPEGDLGQRQEAILRRALSQAPAALALGADSPGRPAHRLPDALAALRDHDAVIGPTEDGGYDLLGLRSCPPGLLAGVRWSGPHAAADVTARLRAAGLRVAVLSTWWDVDTADDLVRLHQALEHGLVAPATRRLVARSVDFK